MHERDEETDRSRSCTSTCRTWRAVAHRATLDLDDTRLRYDAYHASCIMVAQGYLQGARALGSQFSTNKLYKVEQDCGRRR